MARKASLLYPLFLAVPVATFLLALLFGACNNAQGNASRPLFNIVGPLLSLSAAALLTNRKSHLA